MTASLIPTLVLAALVGVALGALGGGGSILTVPLLTYVAGMPPKEAIATSLVVVGVTSLFSLGVHARHRRVRWRTGLIFGAAGMVGAFAGGMIGGHLPGAVLMVAFALVMIATALAMITRSSPAPHTDTPGAGTADDDGSTGGSHDLPVVRTLIDGVVVGLVTGVVGAGGGFLIVPALVLLGGLSMPIAVGTSLLVIAMKSFAGAAGYLTTVSLNWPVVAAVTAMAVLGALVGARISGRVPAATLQRGFGVFVLVTGAVVLALELPAAGAIAVGAIGLIAVILLAVCRLTTVACPFGIGHRERTIARSAAS
ncbi:sulfite exporter TauE/SafE family protein [Millisia brevis]|uniref:sulfite exporter TauE/SafE family protein n=1 Tax=Millisia brevis TaxID=264148 RepID=UPI000829B87C|nr:sulfite exporter TauE/SafE family protein [Millisia brevis]